MSADRDIDEAIFAAERYGEDLEMPTEPGYYLDRNGDDWPVEYCDLCERDGHTFSACPARDDESGGEQ